MKEVRSPQSYELMSHEKVIAYQVSQPQYHAAHHLS